MSHLKRELTGVHVTGETATARHFFTSGRHFSQSFSVRTHIRENDKDVLLALLDEQKMETMLNGRGGKLQTINMIHGKELGREEENFNGRMKRKELTEG